MRQDLFAGSGEVGREFGGMTRMNDSFLSTRLARIQALAHDKKFCVFPGLCGSSSGIRSMKCKDNELNLLRSLPEYTMS